MVPRGDTQRTGRPRRSAAAAEAAERCDRHAGGGERQQTATADHQS